MNPQDALKLAKQGDANAIATLINSSLQGKGIIAKVTQKDHCLQIILESAETPNQESLVNLIRKGLISLKPGSINRVTLYARQPGNSLILWSERFSLTVAETPKNTPTFAPAMSVEASQQLKKEAKKKELEFNMVFWGIIFLFGGCTVYAGGYPWTCQQAEDAVREAQRDLGRAYNQNLDDNRLYSYSYVLSNKQGIRDRKCSN
ncbi:hypothetical protein [Anabaena lutea]|uniref:Uncharacterized protein n=1 Tax=Anabaena lutea FACHB-196 TaxID=2692881 RepID=A0ABR8FM73_9NOST|nr:hypothetical protein [Anabaena lutea]MBD2570039.1 hypothetical protein [Anabaena lutea FACHB-196]